MLKRFIGLISSIVKQIVGHLTLSELLTHALLAFLMAVIIEAIKVTAYILLR